MVEIQLYWVKIPDDVEMKELDASLNILDKEERAVYHRYRVDFKKVEFLIGRLLLKTQLGVRLQMSPEKIHFQKGEYGKLYLADRDIKAKGPTVHFNLSHSDRMVVCGFTTHGGIGVDVEYAERDNFAVMQTVYATHEIAFVDTKQTVDEKLIAFYLLWTRKEAYIKALGTGFSLSPLTFSVPLEMGRVSQAEWEYNTFRQSRYMISTVTVRATAEEISYKIQGLDFHELLHMGT